MARRPAAGIRRAARALQHRDAARRARLARDDVQRRNDPRATLGHRERPCRTARLDRRLARAEGEGMATTEAVEVAREQTRTCYPDQEGYVERDGVRVFYEAYGDGEPTILFLPTWTLLHSRCWKLQIPYFARHHRVVTFDPRGNGKSDRPRDTQAYSEEAFAADALAVMDATATQQALLVSLSLGSQRALILAANHPERVIGSAFIAPSLPIAPGHSYRNFPFLEPLDTEEGWARFNAHYWLRDYKSFVEFFISQCVTESHST